MPSLGSSKSFSSVSQSSASPTSPSPSSLSSSLLSSSLLSSSLLSSSPPPSSSGPPPSSFLSSSLSSSSRSSSSLSSSSPSSSSPSLSSSSRSSSSVSCGSSCPSIPNAATDDTACAGTTYTKFYGFSPDFVGLVQQPVHWDILTGPAGATLSDANAISGTLSWNIPAGTSGVQSFAVRCTDACGCSWVASWNVTYGPCSSSSSGSCRSTVNLLLDWGSGNVGTTIAVNDGSTNSLTDSPNSCYWSVKADCANGVYTITVTGPGGGVFAGALPRTILLGNCNGRNYTLTVS